MDKIGVLPMKSPKEELNSIKYISTQKIFNFLY